MIENLTVIGCGSVGSWLAYLAVKAGVKEIFLYDDDIVEEKNLIRSSYTKHSVGKPKVEALAEILRALSEKVKIFPFKERVSNVENCNGSLFIDCRDSEIPLRNSEKLFPLKVGYDGDELSIIAGNPKIWGEPAIVDYNRNPNPITPVIAATILLHAINKYKFDNNIDNLHRNITVDEIIKLW